MNAALAQPAATVDVKQVADLNIRAAKLMVNATNDLVLALVRGDEQLLANGGNLLTRAGALEQQSANNGDALYQRLGGYAAFGNRIDFQALWNQLTQIRNATK